jgi:hypothetical protein
MKNSINLSIVALSILFFTSIQAEKKLSPQAEATFQQIQKIWNSHEKTLRDFNKNVINVGMSKIQEDVQNTLSDGPGSIDAPEILNLINSIKDQKNHLILSLEILHPPMLKHSKRSLTQQKIFLASLYKHKSSLKKITLKRNLLALQRLIKT